jgi:hypothetical protein
MTTWLDDMADGEEPIEKETWDEGLEEDDAP